MWRRIPHLIQQQETPRKGYKINNVEHLQMYATSSYKKELKNNKKEDKHED